MTSRFYSMVVALMFVVSSAMTAQAQPPSFVDLGVIGNPGTFIFNTDNSLFADGVTTIDTELGLFDSDGILLDSDDDGSTGFFSEITFDAPAGEYFLAISEFDSVFADGFQNTGTQFEAGESGTAVLNINGVEAGSQVIGNPDTGNDPTGFFRVEVVAVPEPGSALVLLFGGFFFVRRRSL